jgi:hypothetical protein
MKQMKEELRKDKDSLKTIDPEVLTTILGGIQSTEADPKNATVIGQSKFSSFFHS